VKPRRSATKERLPITSLRLLITTSTAFKPSQFNGTEAERAAIEKALRVLSRATFNRLLFVPYLAELRKELHALNVACSSTSSIQEALLLTRDDGLRGMEEVAGNLLADDAFAEPFGLLRLYLRPLSAARYLRGLDATFPLQLREVIKQLLEWVDKRLEECGEPRGTRKRGRPAEHPAVVEATQLLSNAGLTPAKIAKAIGNEISALREHTRQTRNRKSYERPGDLRRTIRRHRGKKSS
jgi:hypothetical protein